DATPACGGSGRRMRAAAALRVGVPVLGRSGGSCPRRHREVVGMMRDRSEYCLMRHLFLYAALAAAIVPLAAAAQPTVVPDAYLATIVDDAPPPLPRGLAPGERVPSSRGLRGAVPPGGPLRAIAEYEGNAGIMIRWGNFNAL